MITGKINLSALTHVKMSVKGQSGNDVEGIFIPLDINRLFRGKDGATYLSLVAFDMKEPKEWGTHIIKQSISKEEREKMGETEMPILGNLKVGEVTHQAPVNNAGGENTFTPEDKLPF